MVGETANCRVLLRQDRRIVYASLSSISIGNLTPSNWIDTDTWLSFC
jgi:hypothetical protein